MDRAEAVIELKQKLGPLDAYLRGRNIDIGANGKKCFRCLNPEHEDKNPSMQYLGANVYCHSCHATYDTVALMAMERNMNPGQFIEWGYEHYGIPITRGEGASPSSTGKAKPPAPKKEPETELEQDYTAYFEECHKRIGETDYPQRRGLTRKTIERFQLGYDAAFTAWEKDEQGNAHKATWKALIIPDGPGHFAARNTNPDATGKNRYRFSPGPRMPFNLQALQGEKPVFITEGQLDALSVMEVGGEALALGGNGTEKLLAALEKAKPAKPLILSLDKDERGRKAEDELAADLKERGIPYLRADITGEHKDANEAYNGPGLADFALAVHAAQKAIRTEQEEALEAERAAYMTISAAASMESFFAEMAEKKKPYATGFNMLDRELKGGLFAGLTIVGALTSAGKTTLVMQMADTMAQAGNDVLIFSLETGRNELIAKSISLSLIHI